MRVRSLPVKADGKLPKKAAAITGALLEGRASAHAYIVFEERAAAEAALAHNMQEVRRCNRFCELVGLGGALMPVAWSG